MNITQKEIKTGNLKILNSEKMKTRNPLIVKQLPRLIFAIIVIMLFEGCASAEFVSTGKSYSPKPDNCEIEIFLTKNPDRKYEELGILEGEGSWGKDSFDSILPKLKIEACRAGGDAIIFSSSQKSVNIFPLGEGSGSDEKLNVTATVIKWLQ
jgi:hypothetical protein